MEKCQVCSPELDKPSKYKCPQCTIRFCSLECFKKHKNEAEAAYHCSKFIQQSAVVTFKEERQQEQ